MLLRWLVSVIDPARFALHREFMSEVTIAGGQAPMSRLLRWMRASKAVEMLRDYRRGQRLRKICAQLDLTKQGLEIGPSYNGLLKKRDGYSVKILDHLPTDALKAKYIAQGIDGAQIETVDYVWDGRPFAETVGPGERFAWIVASHVIEHTPCLITFLRDCESILAPDGTLSLAVPDKRFTFDCLRERTSIAQVIDTFHAGAKKPSIGAVADHHLNAAKRGGRLHWRRGWPGRLEYAHQFAEAARAVETRTQTDLYMDIHNWVFTPSAARLLLSDLHQLGYIGLREIGFSEGAGSEFFISLSLAGAGPDLSRKALARMAQREVA